MVPQMTPQMMGMMAPQRTGMSQQMMPQGSFAPNITGAAPNPNMGAFRPMPYRPPMQFPANGGNQGGAPSMFPAYRGVNGAHLR